MRLKYVLVAAVVLLVSVPLVRADPNDNASPQAQDATGSSSTTDTTTNTTTTSDGTSTTTSSSSSALIGPDPTGCRPYCR